LLSVTAGCCLVVLASCSGGDGDNTSVLEVDTQPIDERCLQFEDDVGAQVTEFPWVACNVAHSHEVFEATPFLESLTNTSTGSIPDVYPGFDRLESFAERACLEAFEPYVGISAFDSKLFYSWLVPTLASWNDFDDNEIVCVAGNADSTPLEATIQNSQR
jgi:hypothetical protein